LVALALSEGLLRLVEYASSRDQRFLARAIGPDRRLGSRLGPGTPGHDERGFRNARVLSRADVVAIGDSQTWGINADRSSAWPQVLQRLTGRSVYQMSLGGYGPVQYWALAGDALELSPRLIVVGLYFGNDLWDAYRAVYQGEFHAALRRVDASADLLHDTVITRADRLWADEKNYLANYGRAPSGWATWLRGHTAVGRLLDRTVLRWAGLPGAWQQASRAWARASPDQGCAFEDGKVGTVFTTAYRLLALNLDEPRIAEGLRITKTLLEQTARRVSDAGIVFVILLIPTKESAYAELAQRSDCNDNGSYRRLVATEARVRDDVLGFCRSAHLTCLDARPALAQALAQGTAVYPETTESHPTPAGYRVVATVVQEEVNRLVR
jgi:hypothetical protein